MDVRFKFEHIGSSIFGSIHRPVAKVLLDSPHIDKSVNIWMVVDTGADFTIIPRHFAEKLRISFETDCAKDSTFGVGGEQAIFFCKNAIIAHIGHLKRSIPLAFFDSNEVPALLGRQGFLETFDTTFLKKHTVIFKD